MEILTCKYIKISELTTNTVGQKYPPCCQSSYSESSICMSEESMTECATEEFHDAQHSVS